MFFITVILVISSLVFVIRGNRFSLFTKERTYLLKALLPYIIFIYHSHLFDWDFKITGPFVVSIFYFMSGYGLETKRIIGEARSINYSFFINALRKLLSPLFIPIIVFLLLRLYNTSFSVVLDEDVRKYQLILPFTWFVVTLVILYLFFYASVVISNRIKSKRNICLVIITIEVLLFNIIGRFIGVPGYAHVTTTAFIAGFLYKRYENDIMNLYNKGVKMLTVISSIVIILLVVYIQSQVFGNIDRPLTAFVWPICFMLLYAVIPTFSQQSGFGKVITYLSSISYELYICQSIAFILLGAKSQYHTVVYIILLFILCTIVASVCKYIASKIFFLKSSKS